MYDPPITTWWWVSKKSVEYLVAMSNQFKHLGGMCVQRDTYPGYSFDGTNPSYFSITVDVHSQTPPLWPFPPSVGPPVVAGIGCQFLNPMLAPPS